MELAPRPTALLAPLALAGLLASTVPAAPADLQLADYLPAGTTYDPAIPTPRSVLGFEVGAWHVRPDELVRYMETLAARSERVAIEETGRTYEGRPLVLLTISSPANLARIDEIRRAHLALSDPAAARPDSAAMPVVVYLGYSIHGNEASGSNASLAVAYHLAAAQGEEIEAMLDHAVVLLDPSFNPDGMGRFSEWANEHRGAVPVADPASREHNEAWPGGRTNHYWFDLNRDWLLVQHPESQARIAQFHRWKPNVLADFHEMGSDSTYFFQPGVPSRQNPLTPPRNLELTKAIARFHTAALDRAGRLYFSQEQFDDFYYGKGSTYPDANGGVGILFEQASARGVVRESDHGRLDLPFAIQNHVLTSFSTLRGALAERRELLDYQADFYRSALDEAARDPVGARVFGDPSDPVRTTEMVELLRRHQVRVHRLGVEIERQGQRFTPESAYVVPSDQPQYRLVRVLFDRVKEFADTTFYDVSTWTLPLACGVPDAEVGRKGMPSGLLGAAVEWPEAPRGSFAPSPDAYAYAFGWNGTFAPRALYRLLAAEAHAHVATRPFTAETDRGPHTFERGTVVLPMGRQTVERGTIETALATIAAEDGVAVYALPSGGSSAGVDLGSPNLRPLVTPQPALVVGDGVSAYDAGEIWHLLDHRCAVELPLLDKRQLGRRDLDRYTHLILVDGGYDDLAEGVVRELRRWVRHGGVLVATQRAAGWAASHVLPASWPAEEPTHATDTAPPAEAPPRLPYEEHEPRRAAELVSGAVFEVELDLTHPLAYGYPRPLLPVFRDTTLVLEPPTSPYATVARYTEEPLLSGYASAGNLEKLAATPAVTAQRVGDGLVVEMADDPAFRAYWKATQKLFLNALFFGPIVEPTGE